MTIAATDASTPSGSTAWAPVASSSTTPSTPMTAPTAGGVLGRSASSGPASSIVTMADHVARIQAEWARERPDVDVTPQGVIGRPHRLAALLTEELCLVYRRHGLSEGAFDVLEPADAQRLETILTTLLARFGSPPTP
ncbi:hypothetical protein [Saccharothrix coeruleofusca]|uniref:Uncharacterized protein n=1 Tax=Saccharothrix coeruleofusca TaxID=33919 RepID=A0A918ASL9_9PSEU|nr:hypothetical protein [Saccharothrix coeruleofusca]MBP2336715.1 hypothetical protein [Saccharothrix coeruleofusca]GGP78541.1 hypothetical protein GCM10010185_60430 [Saccharothrix coeruleofusca]